MEKTPSIFGGACIIAGVCVGAGMLGLPISGAGAWTWVSLAAIILTMVVMTISGLMLLETFKHYDIHASFDTVTNDLLGKKLNMINDISVYFVGGILLYAYITTSGGILQQLTQINNKVMSIIFVLIFAAVVWHSTRLVDRISTILIIFMGLSFIFSISGMAANIKLDILFDSHNADGAYLPYFFGMLPVALVSFGYHHSVASMRIYYGDEHKAQKAIIGGTSIALGFYIIWLVSIFGNLPRAEFTPVIEKSGEIEALLAALGNAIESKTVAQTIHAFSIAAILSSFIGVGLGLFDFLADFFHRSDDKKGRFITCLFTFVPPLILSLLFPFGFVIAIGYAGAAATIWACIIPALLVSKVRKRHPNAGGFKTVGGSGMVIAVIIYGVAVMIFHFMNMLELLPAFKG